MFYVKFGRDQSSQGADFTAVLRNAVRSAFGSNTQERENVGSITEGKVGGYYKLNRKTAQKIAKNRKTAINFVQNRNKSLHCLSCDRLQNFSFCYLIFVLLSDVLSACYVVNAELMVV